ncbi:hypothetical protein FQZ97_524370 [compost metagenome]|jgi:hypothetical protein
MLLRVRQGITMERCRCARQAADANGAVIWRYLTLIWQSKLSAGATPVSQGR